jgi:outer membrane lipoprotein-sorting protein
MSMGDLGDVLELLHDAEPRWQTLRAVGRQWRHNTRASEAFERHFAALEVSQPAGSVVRLTASHTPEGSQAPEPDESEDAWRLSMERGGRTRAEFSVGPATVSVVFDGPTWWSWSPRMGGMTNRGAGNHGHGTGPARVLINTSTLLCALRLQCLGTDTLLGRDVFRLRGVPRPRVGDGPDHDHHELGVGADDYLLSVDAERGVALRCEARFREEPFMVLEMTEVEFDADLPEETFTVILPEGETFEDVTQRGKAYWPRRSRFVRRGRQRKGS